MKYPTLVVAMAAALMACTCTAESKDTPAPPVTVPRTPQVTQAEPEPSAAPVLTEDYEDEDGESPLEEAILNRAEQCERAKTGKFNRDLLRDMLRNEEDYKVPLQLRGMVLAAACVESGFDPNGEGDHKFSKDGKTPVALGILQQWPWWSKSPLGPKINRRNPRQASDAWLAHVAKQVPSVTRKCDFRASQTELVWRTAWVTGVRGPSKKPRCTQVSKHWTTFLAWRTAWEPMLKPKTIAQR